MDNKKKIIVTIWISAIILTALICVVPVKSDRYFVSLRVLFHERQAVQANIPKNDPFKFLRDPKGDVKVIQMLEEAANEDGKWFFICIGAIFIVVNAVAVFLYIFNMTPVHIALWVAGPCLITGALVFQSFIRISPF